MVIYSLFQLSSACEEARKCVSLLPSLPASSRLAVLLSESQKLVEAVNKHVAVASLYQAGSPREELQLTNRKALSWSKVKGQALSVKSEEAIKASETEQRLTESLQGFGLFVQRYSYTTDDIIIRGNHMIEKAGSFDETALSDGALTVNSCCSALSDELISQQSFLSQHDLITQKHNHEQSQHALLYCGLPESSEKPEPQNKPPSPRKGGPSGEQLIQFQDHITRVVGTMSLGLKDM